VTGDGTRLFRGLGVKNPGRRRGVDSTPCTRAEGQQLCSNTSRKNTLHQENRPCNVQQRKRAVMDRSPKKNGLS